MKKKINRSSCNNNRLLSKTTKRNRLPEMTRKKEEDKVEVVTEEITNTKIKVSRAPDRETKIPVEETEITTNSKAKKKNRLSRSKIRMMNGTS